MAKQEKKSLGEWLVERGIINQKAWEEAQAQEKVSAEPLRKVLIRMGLISEEDMVNFISQQMDIQRIDLSNYLIDSKIIDLVPELLARKYQMVPILKIGKSLTCAMVDPLNIFALDELRAKTGLTIEPAVATETEIKKALDESYTVKGSMDDVIKSMDEQKVGVVQEGEEIELSKLKGMVEEPPVIRLVNMMIMDAVGEGVSDIHIEPEEDKLSIRFRIDGVLRREKAPPKHFQSAIISRIKVLANLDIAERRKPQDGRFHIKMGNHAIDIRVSSVPTSYGENIVMRLLDSSSILFGLEQLGFTAAILKVFQGLLVRPNGIILVTGPTGSGKTSTLYAALNSINTPDKNIITIEDPVEYHLEGIRQIQVNPQVDLTFANGLRSILRQDPDVIMVGEIRDVETAEIAIQAALTGHLVFATLHTNDAPGAITRLVDMGVEPFLIASSVAGVVAQRLVRIFCKDCKGKGCKNCHETGYRGRQAINELMCFDEDVRTLVMKKASSEEIRRVAITSGMKSLRDDGLDKVKSGVTSKEEVLRVTQE
ncbi:MAG: Flp pilus assembly complex ATPase component TadA [Candidatus Omnitrophica bacterium]|nr:Flp pilus assembly complex ATPase component TadA [Candidatus Omnitrophota bacterium]